ncbi:MAG TPA: 30S ribosomal protein S2, partial [Opitutaceae bacterium]|nr:30S ribosomal protein S2 [Opitutaceae bacterium]
QRDTRRAARGAADLKAVSAAAAANIGEVDISKVQLPGDLVVDDVVETEETVAAKKKPVRAKKAPVKAE